MVHVAGVWSSPSEALLKSATAWMRLVLLMVMSMLVADVRIIVEPEVGKWVQWMRDVKRDGPVKEKHTLDYLGETRGYIYIYV